MKVYVGLQWNLLRGDSSVSGGELRAAKAIRPFVRTAVDRRNSSQRAMLTDAGVELLANWNGEYGNPLTEESE
jgi:hypothetical protein